MGTMSDSDSSSSSSSGSSPKSTKVKSKAKEGQEKKSGKSSAEILNELFGTFNSSFDEGEATSSRNRSKNSSHSPRKKKKSKEKVKEKDKSSKKDRSKSKESSKKEKSHRKRKSKSPPILLKKENNEVIPLPVTKSKYPTIEFQGKTIVLDIEEGEITEEAERRAERKKHLRKRSEKEESEEQRSSNKKKKKSHESLSDDEKLSSSSKADFRSSKSKQEGRRDSYSDHYEDKSRRDSYNTTSSSSGSKKRKDSYHKSHSKSRSRSRSPSQRGERNPRNDKSYYQSLRWEKARDRSPDKSYYYNSARRNSANEYEYNKRYNEGRGGFGYSGSSSRQDNEDDNYDYRRNRDRGSHSRRKSRSPSSSSSRSRYRERSTLRRLHPDDIIDKGILLEIARKNAAKLMKQGVLPTDIFSRDQILAIKAGGKSVEELTEYCKRVAKRDALGDAGGDSSDDEHLIHHPFNVKDRPMPAITLNIRNAIPLPIRSPHELAIENAKLKIQFPVSSGTQHRYKELEWKVVDKDDEKDKDKEKDKEKEKEKKKEDLSKALVPLTPKIGTVAPMLQKFIPDPEIKPLEITLEPKPSTIVDIGSVISKRLRAMKELQENPDDTSAKEKLDAATSEMKEWAEAKALEPKFLTPAELLTGPQAWAKKDQLKTATAVQGGMGMHLLQRMGWSPGEGLGKNKEGSTEPLALDIKTDKKGLASSSDLKGPSLPSVFDLSGKHPVSSLMELCAKRRWGDPTFLLCFEHGPAHKRQFVYKVTVNGVEYQPCVATKNKKEAKANAAAFCLQSLGLLPTPKPTVISAPPQLLQTVPTTTTITSSSTLGSKSDTKLMPPPPPPPPALTKLLDLPLPLPHSQSTNIPPLIPPKLVTSHTNFPHLQSRLMNLAGVSTCPSPTADGMFVAPTIVQLPLPPSSLQGFPGLTTF